MRGAGLGLRCAQKLGRFCATSRIDVAATDLRVLGTEATGFTMQHNKSPNDVFREFEPLEDALRAFIAERGTTELMPTRAQLHSEGRNDLVGAINRYHGGFVAVAGRLGLEMTQDHLPDHHWKDAKVMERAVLACIEEHGTPGVMLTQAQLEVCGRSDLYGGIRRYHGGIRAVTQALGLQPGSNPPSVQTQAYWQKWENVEAEMPAVSEACGVPGQMPTSAQLLANGYSSLLNAIHRHYGGMHGFVERLKNSLPLTK